jgi:hypothetical protein
MRIAQATDPICIQRNGESHDDSGWAVRDTNPVGRSSTLPRQPHLAADRGRRGRDDALARLLESPRAGDDRSPTIAMTPRKGASVATIEAGKDRHAPGTALGESPIHATVPGAPEILFGSFRLRPTERLLLDGDRAVRIGGRALDLLISLVERAGELVTKDDLVL